jgi:hypothetical protein
MTDARGCCYDIFLWFSSEYELYDLTTGSTTNGLKLALEYLSHQASVILAYKKKALNQETVKDGSDSSVCTIEYLETQINLCFQKHKEIPPIKILAIDGDEQLSLALTNKDLYGVRKLEVPRPYEGKFSFTLT